MLAFIQFSLGLESAAGGTEQERSQADHFKSTYHLWFYTRSQLNSHSESED